VNDGTCAVLSHPHGRDLTSAERQAAPAHAREEERNVSPAHRREGSLRRPRQVAAGCFRWRSYGGAARGASPPLLSESTRLGAEPDVEVRIVRAFSVDPGRREALRLRRERTNRHVARATHGHLAGLRHLRCQRPGYRRTRSAKRGTSGYVADRDHVVFRCSATHSGDEPKAFFKGFRGTVLSDASNVYDILFGLPESPGEANLLRGELEGSHCRQSPSPGGYVRRPRLASMRPSPRAATRSTAALSAARAPAPRPLAGRSRTALRRSARCRGSPSSGPRRGSSRRRE
jgi:hypothetical protein